jgi:hypothetical protein
VRVLLSPLQKKWRTDLDDVCCSSVAGRRFAEHGDEGEKADSEHNSHDNEHPHDSTIYIGLLG